VNYAALVTAIQDTTENYDPTFIAYIPLFVKAAEKRIYNAVKVPAAAQLSSATLTPNLQYLACPDDFIASDYLASFEFAVVRADGTWSYLQNKDVGYIREAFPNPLTTGLPRFYAMLDEDTFVFGPTPDDDYTVQLRYRRYPESIVTAGTTWLGDNFERLMMYGALLEAAVFMKSPADVTDGYGKSFAYELGLLKQHNNGELPPDAYSGDRKAGS
jgi:hypothetical protein